MFRNQEFVNKRVTEKKCSLEREGERENLLSNRCDGRVASCGSQLVR